MENSVVVEVIFVSDSERNSGSSDNSAKLIYSTLVNLVSCFVVSLCIETLFNTYSVYWLSLQLMQEAAAENLLLKDALQVRENRITELETEVEALNKVKK